MGGARAGLGSSMGQAEGELPFAPRDRPWTRIDRARWSDTPRLDAHIRDQQPLVLEGADLIESAHAGVEVKATSTEMLTRVGETGAQNHNAAHTGCASRD